MGIIHIAMGQYDAAANYLEMSRTIRAQLGDTMGLAQSYASQAHLDICLQNYEQATAKAQRALELAETIGSDESRVYAGWVLAMATALTGDHEAGLQFVTQALEVANHAGLSDQLPDCLRVRGVAQAVAGDYSAAETSYRQAAEIARQQTNPYRQGLALSRLGRLYQLMATKNGGPDVDHMGAAIQAFNEAAAIFESLGAAADLALVRERLTMMTAPAGEPVVAEAIETAEVRPAQAPPVAVARPVPEQQKRPPVAAPPRAATRKEVFEGDLPDGEWCRAAIGWLVIEPPPGGDAELFYESLVATAPQLAAIVEEEQAQLMRRPGGYAVVTGAPVAHEDDPIRALRALSRIMAQLSQQSDSTPALTARAALSYGEVVAGFIGNHEHREFTVKGVPWDEARRLAACTKRGQIWVTDAVMEATQDEYRFTMLPAADTSHIFAAGRSIGVLAGPRPHAGQIDQERIRRTPMVGRDAELATMLEAAAVLNQGTGGLVWIEGEAGIGKSRLLREFSLAIHEKKFQVIQGECSARNTRQPFSLFATLIAHALGLHTVNVDGDAAGRIAEAVGEYFDGDPMARPILQILLGIAPDKADTQLLADLEPDQLQQQMFGTVHRLLSGLAAQRPLVILVDDLHWADSWSIALLAFLMPLVATSPVLFVHANRPALDEFASQQLLEARSAHTATSRYIRLDVLTPVASEALLDALAGGHLPPALKAYILENGHGNPYYIEAFFQMLVERGHLLWADDGWEPADSVNPADLQLPHSLETLIRARVSALSPRQKRLLQYATVLGRSFEAPLMAAIMRTPDVADELAYLTDRTMLTYEPAKATWRIDHALLGSIVYRSLLRARRTMMHRQVARALEEYWSDHREVHAGELAYHLLQAGETRQALDYLVLAGEWAASCSGTQEALAHFDEAARIATEEPSTPDTLRWRIYVGLGDVYRIAGSYAEAERVLRSGLSLVTAKAMPPHYLAGLYRRLGETSQSLGELETARRYYSVAYTHLRNAAGPEATGEQARVLLRLAWTYLRQGDWQQALQLAQDGLARAEATKSVRDLSMAENLLGGIYFRSGNVELSARHMERALALTQKMGHSGGIAAINNNLGILAVATGRWLEAKTYFEDSLRISQEMGDVAGAVIAHQNLGLLYRDLDDMDAARNHLEAGLETVKRYRIGYHKVSLTLGLAQIMQLEGESKEALESIQRAFVEARETGARDLMADALQVQAEVLQAQGRNEEALKAAQRAYTLARETGSHRLASATARVAAAGALALQDLNGARRWIAKAQAALEHVTDRLEYGRVTRQEALICLAQGQKDKAGLLLESAQQIFAALEAKRDLALVDSLTVKEA